MNPQESMAAKLTQFATNSTKKVNENYVHNQINYKNGHQMIQMILNYQHNFDFTKNENKEAILVFGKTGWGKSTTINYLNGLEFRLSQNECLVPIDPSKSITKIGNGKSSTTMMPVFCKTKFGQVYDLPGDQETRGVGIQILNGIFKKKIAKTLKKLKLVFVIPKTIINPQGSYGNGLKDVLQSYDKFIGGLNNYKDNILFIITFADRRRNQLQNIIEQLQNLLVHEDKILDKYSQLITHVINHKRIKLFAKPSQKQGQELYSVPNYITWQIEKKQTIIQCLKTLSFGACQQKNFSVPLNIKLSQFLKQIMKVLKGKITNIYEQNFQTIQISGIQLSSLINFLNNLNQTQNKSLQQFNQIYSINSYLKTPNINDVKKEIQFIFEFMKKQKNQIYKTNWINPKFQQKITQTLNQALKLKAINLQDFKKKSENKLLKVIPNQSEFNNIQSKMINLESLYKNKKQLQNKKTNEQSQYYENYTQKVYDKTIQQPYQIDEKYIQQQSKTTTVQVPRIQYYQTPVTKYRTAYKNETQYYNENQPRTRPVTHYRTQQHCTQGGRKYGGFGRRKKHYYTVQIPYQVNQVYYVNVQKQRQVSKPYQQIYIDYVQNSRIVYDNKTKTQKVPVEKTRKKIMYKNKQVYKDVTKRRLWFFKYDFALNRATQKIIKLEKQIASLLNSLPKSKLNYNVPDIQQNLDQILQGQYKKLLKMWKESEYNAFNNKYRGVRKIKV